MDDKSTNKRGRALSSGDASLFEVPALPHGVGVQPQVDSIFADVQANLPSIYFDVSDVSSDEEVALVNPSLKTQTLPQDDPNREIEMTPETWLSALEPTNQSSFAQNYVFPEYAVPPYEPLIGRKASDSSDSSAAELMTLDSSIIQVGSAHPLPDAGMHFGDGSFHQIQSWSDIINTLGIRENGMHLPSSENSDVIPYWRSSFNTPEADLDNRKASTTPDPTADTKLRAERRLSTDSDKSKIASLIPTQVPVLSLRNVEDHDLDQLLSCIPSMDRGIQEDNSRPASHSENGSGDGIQTESQTLSLMEKLAQLCIQQSDGALSKHQLLGPPPKQFCPENSATAGVTTTTKNRKGGTPRATKVAWGTEAKHDKKTREIGTNTGKDGTFQMAKQTSSIGVSTLEHSTRSTGVGTSQTSERTETIFLDLRPSAESQEEKVVPESVKRILKLNSPRGSESDSSDESEDENLEVWRQNRKRGFQPSSPPSTKAEKTSITSEDITETSITVTATLTPTLTPTTTTIKHPAAAPETPIKTSSGHPKTSAPKTLPLTPPPSPTAAGKDRVKDKKKLVQSEVRRKLREQCEHERAARLRLQKRLEALRPRVSASGKKPSARSTPVIYDLEASYTAQPQSLPPGLHSDQECALLTVHLSTSGEIIPQRCPGSNRTTDGENHISITYPALLAWLLSLVPPDFDYLREGTKSNVELIPKPEPFWVVGLQQAYSNNELVLNVVVMPTGSDLGKQQLLKRKTKGLGKEAVRDNTIFQSHISKFLTINTLQTVCPWVEDAFAQSVRTEEKITNSTSKHDLNSSNTVFDDGSYAPLPPHITSKPLSMLLTLSQDRGSAQRILGSGDAAFFWQTVDSDEVLSEQTSNEEYDSYTDVQNTVSLVYRPLYCAPKQMFGFLYRILQEGFDVAGLRLLYQIEKLVTSNLIESKSDGNLYNQDQECPNKLDPVLAIAVRGAMARTRWLDAIGPTDPQLARRTDPRSLTALFGGQSRDDNPMYCSRNPTQASYDLALWFGGRVPENGVIDVGSVSSVTSQQKVEAARVQSPSQKTKRGKRGSQTDVNLPDLDTEIVRKPPSMLVATTPSDIFLVISPIVPPTCVGSVLEACQIRGFQLRGVRRLRLNNRRIATLGLIGPQVRAFNPLSCTTPTSPVLKYEQSLKEQLEAGFPQANPSPMPSLLLLLRRENAMHHAPCLVEALMVSLCMNGMLTTIKDNSPSGTLTASLCFHVAPYSESLLGQLGGDLTSLPSSSSLLHYGLGASPPGGFYTNPELEQVVVVTLSGTKALKTAGNTISRLLGLYPFTSSTQPPVSCVSSPTSIGQGLELLGLKWLVWLTAGQAKELTPYEVGDRYWQPSVQALTSNPALICIVRGINAPQLVQSIVGTCPLTGALPNKGALANLERIMSTSAESAFRQATMFFRDQELFADPSMRVNLPFLPPLRSPSLEDLSTARFAWAETEMDSLSHSPSKGGRRGKLRGGAKQQQGGGAKHQGKGALVVEESIYKAMLIGPRPLTTVAVIKPLAFRKHLAKILKRIAQESFNIVAMRLTVLDVNEATALVPTEDRDDEVLHAMHQEHLSSGPVLLLCLQRENAVRKLLDLLGPNNPQDARKQSQFLWRGMYGSDPINNGIHGSVGYLAAVGEEKLLFPDGLCCRENPDLQADKIFCPARDSVMGYPQASKRRFEIKPYPVRTDSNDSLLSPVISTHSLTSVASSSSNTSLDLLLLPPHSALCQTTCLLLTPPLLLTKVKGYHRGHVEVMDALVVHGFFIVGMRMVWFNEDQARQYSGVYSKSFPSLPKILSHGPSIVIATQRDNAVSCFDALLGSSYDKESIISKYGEHILRPKDSKEAAKHLEFFFDKLIPRSQGDIVPV